MTVYVGTSGYYYPEWVGPVYPEGMKSSKMLEIYSGMFDAVEINSTFYRPPAKNMFARYKERTGGQMKVIIKLHENFTHHRSAGKEDYRLFHEAVKPLKESGQFSGYLAQFPQSFHFSNDAMRYVEYLRDLIPDETIACEFRHADFWRKDVFEYLKGLNISMCSVDCPSLPNLPPNDFVVSAEPAYVRLHGRNSKEWYTDRMQRYLYQYNKDELKEWLKKVMKYVKQGGDAFVFFNNHPFGYSATNAWEFLELLKEYLGDVVPKRQKKDGDSDQGKLF